jgi:hypothetical protein
MEAVKRQLRAGWYSWGEHTPGIKLLKSGDRICFYAVTIGVVAEAEVASTAERSGRAGEPFPWRFRVQEPRLIYPPNAIDEDLRAKLEAFRGRDTSSRAWPWFVRVTRTVTAHDFRLLTAS